jgi:hypothetical protein
MPRPHRVLATCLLALLCAGLAVSATAVARSAAAAPARHHRTVRRRRRHHRVKHHTRTRPRHRRTARASAAAAHPPASPAALWDGNLGGGNISAWISAQGGAQCANYGVPSANYHQRGSLSFDPSLAIQGGFSARFDLPANVAPYTTSICELLHSVPMGLGTDDWYGFSFYVPPGWDTGTSQFWGVEVAQFHFENIWGAPISFQLHDDHMTLALETGSCDAVSSTNPGCDWRSEADLPAGGPNLPGYYAIPPGSMPQGHWYEIMMHVHWADDSTGQIQTWFRQKGQAAWTPSASMSGHPTVQWDRGTACCMQQVTDKIGAYRGYATAPVSVWIGSYETAASQAGLAQSMP